MQEARSECKICGNVLLERLRHRLGGEGNIKIWGENMNWIRLASDEILFKAVNSEMNLEVS
jgi:hypothetical protein